MAKVIGRILVVDEDMDVLRFLKLNLKQDLYEVLASVDSQESIETVKKVMPNVVFINIKTAKMRWVEEVRRIKNIDENIKVIVTTDDGCMDTAKRAMRLGASDYITKPLDVEILKRLLNGP